MILRRTCKILLLCAAGFAALTLLLMLALKLALDRAPRYQAQIKDWVYGRTGYRIAFAHVSPAFRWYGPELYFDELELRSSDGRRVLARAGGGRIGARHLATAAERQAIRCYALSSMRRRLRWSGWDRAVLRSPRRSSGAGSRARCRARVERSARRDAGDPARENPGAGLECGVARLELRDVDLDVTPRRRTSPPRACRRSCPSNSAGA